MSTDLRRFIADWLWLGVVIAVIFVPFLGAPILVTVVVALLVLPAIALRGWMRQVRSGEFARRAEVQRSQRAREDAETVDHSESFSPQRGDGRSPRME